MNTDHLLIVIVFFSFLMANPSCEIYLALAQEGHFEEKGFGKTPTLHLGAQLLILELEDNDKRLEKLEKNRREITAECFTEDPTLSANCPETHNRWAPQLNDCEWEDFLLSTKGCFYTEYKQNHPNWNLKNQKQLGSEVKASPTEILGEKQKKEKKVPPFDWPEAPKRKYHGVIERKVDDEVYLNELTDYKRKLDSKKSGIDAAVSAGIISTPVYKLELDNYEKGILTYEELQSSGPNYFR